MIVNLQKRKTSYTIMVVPNTAGKSRKNYRLRTGAVVFTGCLLLVAAAAIIGYGAYNSVVAASAANQVKEQKKKIEELEETSAEITREKEELEQQVSELNEALNEKIEEEQILHAEEEQKHIPTGFPMDGAAGIKEEPGEEEQTGMSVNKRRKEIIFTAAAGTSVVATANGTVVSVMPDADYGNLVSIDHGNGYISMYRNNGNPMVVEGKEVEAGAVLYVLEENSLETGYSIRKDDVYIDPMDMFDVKG